jgi:hypothetical protein
MNSQQIKTAVCQLLNVPARAIAVRTIPGKGRKWVDAYIRSCECCCPKGVSFPEDFRRACLSIVYGHEFADKQSAGGNIGVYSISLYADQWETVFPLLAALRHAKQVKMCAEVAKEIV